MKNKPNPDLTIIVPMYNEQECIVESIKKITKTIEKEKISYELIVVDDGSTDNSYILISQEFNTKKNIRILRHTTNKGVSEATRTGFRSAKGTYVTYLDADLQFNPEDTVRFYKTAKESSTPIVWGQSDKSSYSLFRLFISQGHNFLAQLLFSIPSRIDINGMKLIKCSILDNFSFSERKEAFNLELLLHAKKYKHKITSLPIIIAKREQGQSKFHIQKIFQSIKSMILLYLTSK